MKRPLPNPAKSQPAWAGRVVGVVAYGRAAVQHGQYVAYGHAPFKHALGGVQPNIELIA